MNRAKNWFQFFPVLIRYLPLDKELLCFSDIPLKLDFFHFYEEGVISSNEPYVNSSEFFEFNF